MQPRKKKIVVMTAITLGIVAFAFLIPIVIMPVAMSLLRTGSCTDYGCTQSLYSKCGVYQTSGDSANVFDSMVRGIKGMACIMGIDSGAKTSTTSPVTLNKV